MKARLATIPYDGVKRILDIVSAGLLIVLATPVMAIIAVLVAAKLGQPVLFRQPRPGRDGRVFTLLKFRSMLPVDYARGRVEDVDRLTPFGRMLRSTSLDELPSLLNVLLGEMSIVGPRPLLVEYLDRYSPEQARRHEVRPGITGLAQVSGRNAITWEEKFRLDVAYVDSRSFALDARIIAWTFRSVLAQDGISHAEHATMMKFGDVHDN